jgi:hypothetical protein
MNGKKVKNNFKKQKSVLLAINYLLFFNSFLLVSTSFLHASEVAISYNNSLTRSAKEYILSLENKTSNDSSGFNSLDYLIDLLKSNSREEIQKELTFELGDYKATKEKTKKELQEIEQELTNIQKKITSGTSFLKKSKPSPIISLIVSVNEAHMQNLLEKQHYIKNNDDKDDKNASYEKMLYLTDALRLLSSSENDLSDNKKLYKKLSVQYHPDKTNNISENEQQKNILFFKHINSLFNEQKVIDAERYFYDHLENIIKDNTQESNQTFLQMIEKTSLDGATFAGSWLGHATGFITGYKIITYLIPQKNTEANEAQAFVMKSLSSAFRIEKTLLKLRKNLIS